MLTDHERIARQRGDPALLRLHRALGRLGSVLTFMNTGAHPDDEHNGLLAALRFAYGIRIVVACSTRGEGGQNAIGPERGGALGALRTREMEGAAGVIDAGVVWLGHGPDDPVHDFGFSKNGDDTLARWGEERIVERLVRAYRRERPDMVLPTFLDVPGQHGHHRAMTRAAIQAYHRAADPAAFPEHRAEGLLPWRVAKLYLPAWSGAGNSYDDEEPPPPATLALRPPPRDAATGATYAQVGEWSRAFHRSQGMGLWQDAGRAEWPLHLLLAATQAPGPETDIREALPRDLDALAEVPGLPSAMADALRDAQESIAAASAAFPDRERITTHALAAARALDAARAACPDEVKPALDHRLARKARELDALLFEANATVVRAAASPSRVAPGARTTLELVLDRSGHPARIEVLAAPKLRVANRLVEGDLTAIELASAPGAAPTSPYPPGFDPLGGNGDAALQVTLDIGGRPVRRMVDLEEPLFVLPDASLRLDPDAVIINLTRPRSDVLIETSLESGNGQTAGQIDWSLPPGWTCARDAGRIRLTPPPYLKPGRHLVGSSVGGEPAFTVTPVASPHVGRTYLTRPADLPVLAVHADLPPGARVGSVGGGNDRVGTWMGRLGIDVVDLDPERLSRGDLGDLTTIVVGIFAFGMRPDLAAATGRLRAWVEAGGHLVTLYHRPSDGWNPETTPPRRLKIGLPSLRWRVTNPHAPVEVLAPEHPLLTGPNPIGPEDWQGWDKERGLYFAAEWDRAYEPLLAMGDPGEKPLQGALVSGRIGRGRHTHVALVLHHQLDRLVPGAFRLLANLVQPA